MCFGVGPTEPGTTRQQSAQLACCVRLQTVYNATMMSEKLDWSCTRLVTHPTELINSTVRVMKLSLRLLAEYLIT